MKKSVLINLICSLIAVVVLMLAVILVMVFTDVVSVEPEKLVISSASAISTYDGEALTDSGWNLVEGELKEGHELKVTVSGSQSGVGISENYVIATVVDETGADVSEDYNIEYRPGALNVKPRNIRIIADSEIKLYDGTPLTSDKYKIESSLSLLPSHTVEVTIEGSITDIGEEDNRVTAVVIKDENGENVTRNYNVQTTDGKLIVYSVDTIVIESDSNAKFYDGAPLTDSDWKLVSGNLVDGDVLKVNVTGTQTNVGTSKNNIQVKVLNAVGKDVTTRYNFLLNPGNLTVVHQPITITSADDQKVYDGTPLTNSEYTVSPAHAMMPGIIFDVKITGSQTRIGSSPNTIISCKITNSQGEDITENYEISYRHGTLTVVDAPEELKPDLVFESFGGKKLYDGTPLTNPNWRLVSGEVGEKHIANVEVSGSITDAGRADNTIEVKIKDELGNDVSDEYNIKVIPGVLEVSPIEITVETGSAEKIYDGKALTCHDYIIAPNYYTDTYTFTVDIIGSQTEVGESPNTVASVTVFNENGDDISNNFSVTKIEGTLKVNAPEEPEKPTLIYKSASATKVYDGGPLFNTGCERIEGNLLPGHREVIELLSTITEVGREDNKITVTIYDEENNVVNDLYTIKYETGVLEVTKRPIKVQSSSDSKDYDGTPLVNPGYTLTPENNALVRNHTLTVDVVGKIIIPGSTRNTIASCTVADEFGNDVSHCYEITLEEGLLHVNGIDLKITTEGASKFYDGTPLTNPNSKVTPENAVLDGHTLSYSVVGSITDPGVALNTVSDVLVTDADGNDVSYVYVIDVVEGTLEVRERKFTIKANSDKKVYDGTPLKNSGYTVEPKNPIEETHTLTVTVEGSITEIGTVANTVTSYKITDANGDDVTGSYVVQTINGELTVEKIPVSIKTADAKKEYDGTPLTAPTYTVTGMLLDGHSVTATVIGTITEIGTADNEIGVITVTDASGNDVSGYYEIDVTLGELWVYEAGGGEEETPDGTPSSSGEIGLPDDYDIDKMKEIVTFVVTSDKTGTIYLKGISFGDYNGSGWDKAADYGTLILDGASAYYLNAFAIEKSGAQKSSIKIVSKCGQYMIPYYSTSDKGAVQKSDVFVTGDASEEYYLYYFDWAYTAGVTVPEALAEFEEEYAKYVKEKYLKIDEETLDFMKTVIEANGFDKNDPDIIKKVASYIQGAAKYNLKYNRALDKSENIAVDFLFIYKEGICQHYATSATMLYRALGIPARYTTGFVGSTEAGKDVNVTADMAHAWVEVYMDGLGWIQVEVTGGGSGSGSGGAGEGGGDNGSLGDVESDPNKLYFTVVSKVKDTVYLKLVSYGDLNDKKNGWNAAPKYEYLTADQLSAYYLTAQALKNSGLAVTDLKITPDGGYIAVPYYTLEASFDGQISDVDVTGTADGTYYAYYFDWDETSGAALPSRYKDFEAAYARFVEENYLTVDEETLAFLNTVIEQKGFSATDPDIINKVASYIKTAARYNLEYNKALDSESNVIVAFLSEYKEGVCRHYASAATLLYRALGIPARYTVGFAAPVEKGVATEITGKYAHAWVEVYVKGLGWVNVEVTGSGNAATGGDKPINLTVTPVTTEKKYDGTTLYASQSVSGLDKLIKEGYSYQAVVSGESSSLGIAKSTITQLIIYDPFGYEVYNKETGYGGDKFIIKYADGKIHLYLSELKFKSGSYEKTYDGVPLTITDKDCVLTSGQLEDGYTYVLSDFASLNKATQTNSSFTVKVFKDGVDCTDHYKISRTYGTLKVNAREFSVKAKDAEKAYDGKALTCNELEYDESALAEGDYIASYEVQGSQTNIGKCSNIIKSIVIKNQKGEDVTSNYILKTEEGILSVTLP